MIDLHTHILPGLDDGPGDIEGSLAIARQAADDGVSVLAATPHVRDDYPTTVAAMSDALERVRRRIRAEGVELEVLPGAEIALERLDRLGHDELKAFSLGGSSSYLLVELPFFGWPLDVADKIRRLRDAGFTTVVAHPERNTAVQESPARLAELVRQGALVQVTAGSLVGDFGSASAKAAKRLLAAGLVHMLASDVHRAGGPRSSLGAARDAVGDPAVVRWLTEDVPAAIVEGAHAPARPSRSRPWQAIRRRRSTI